MRPGVRDVGFNTGHLLVVDAHPGTLEIPPWALREGVILERLDAMRAT